MPDFRWRTILGWLLTIAIIGYAISDWGSASEPKVVATSEDPEPLSALRIRSISDAEVAPGDAVVVSFAGAAPAPLIEAKVAGKSAEVLVREPDSLVVRIPRDTATGKAGLRLYQGSNRSKAWDLHIRTTSHKKLVARLLGGLALFVFGLGLLALGLRGLAGHRLREWLGNLTGSPARAVAFGTLVGAGTQLTSSSAAFTVGLVDSRMLRVAPAVAVLVGAQLGATITSAVLPVQLSGESLLVIALGVLWTRLAQSRRRRAIANLVLGAGLMLYGLHLLQTSIQPLVGDPAILPYVGYLRSPELSSLMRCAATGALLAFLLQGPGPVYILVVGLAQTTTALPLENALAILAGTTLGSAIGMAVVAWQAGPTTRPLARTQLWFGFAATAFVLATIPAWSTLATAVLPNAASTLDYAHSVVRTRVASQLALGSAAGQLAAGALWLLVLPSLTRRAIRPAAQVVHRATDAPVDRALTEALDKLRVCLGLAFDMSSTGNRTAEAEAMLVDSRALLEAHYRRLAPAETEMAAEQDAHAVVACLQLQRGIEQAVQVAELCVERGIRINEQAKQRLTDMHAIAGESFDALLAALAAGEPPDLEEAGAREIRMNALEAEGRKQTANRPRRRTVSDSTSALHIGVAELIDTFESVGNHLFRIAKALANETDG